MWLKKMGESSGVSPLSSTALTFVCGKMLGSYSNGFTDHYISIDFHLAMFVTIEHSENKISCASKTRLDLE